MKEKTKKTLNELDENVGLAVATIVAGVGGIILISLGFLVGEYFPNKIIDAVKRKRV